jgi:hypothetical protein
MMNFDLHRPQTVMFLLFLFFKNPFHFFFKPSSTTSDSVPL